MLTNSILSLKINNPSLRFVGMQPVLSKGPTVHGFLLSIASKSLAPFPYMCTLDVTPGDPSRTAATRWMVFLLQTP